MLGAGTVINPILKVLTTVAILAAIYFFFVKPTLDTTEKIAAPINESIQQAQDDLDKAFEDSPDASDIRDQISDALNQSGSGTGTSQQQKLLTCIQKANQNIDKITACSDKFTP